MRFTTSLLFLFLTGFAFAQCPILLQISDSVNIDGITIQYIQQDSMVNVIYGDSSFSRSLPKEYSFSCKTNYVPGVPHPTWRNNDFVGFSRGCGSWCFGTFVAPLNATDPIENSGQYLIDSVKTIFMTLYRDTVNYVPHLKLQNCSTGEIQIQKLSSKLLWTTIPLECLDYSDQHKHGFSYQNNVLTLYISSEQKDEIRVKKFKVKV